ncbi:DUF4876 domain-containing protein [Chitinophaga silvatica]|nr:DUF4876 domain-containing protein [Chitinophaga silvatica]
MKRILQQVSACICAMILVLSACKKDSQAPTVNYNVKVSYPASYTSTVAVGVKVTLKNSVTNTTSVATTNAEGVATFNGILPGNYQVIASKDLTAEEALSLTGYSTAVYLNASALNHVIQIDAAPLDLVLNGSKVGGLVFKEVYYACSRTPGGTNYLIDQFYEIYNNSTEVVYADSLCIADVHGSPGNSASSKPTGFQSDVNNVYVRNIWMVPGNGKSHPIEPGKSIIIAQTAINHKTDPAGNPNSVDLGTGIADFEVYVNAAASKDVDNPDVPNMIQIYAPNAGFYWQTYVFGASMIIFKHADPASLPLFTEPGTTSSTQLAQVPNANVIDAVEFLASATVGDKKRIPVSLDAGFGYAGGTYTGESMVRKSKATGTNGRLIYQDTNNTTDDFKVVATPTPKK